MEKAYDPKSVEETIYRMWEEGGYFIPRQDRDKLPHHYRNKAPFSIILPPPNANAPLHMGHAMYTVEDIMIRYHRMKGDPTLWLPGADHAGFETQFVFEKFLAKQGKSRFDYDRDTLYRLIWNFVEQNRGLMETQLKRLGFSLDWSRLFFTLDERIVKIVQSTFKKLFDDKLVYRDSRLVNYCTKCGTGFSDLEVKHIEQADPLYYITYGPFTLATVRPETKFGDTAVAVHPKDKRYTEWIGKRISFDGLTGPVTLEVVADEAVDPTFGTGVVKVTPAHDQTDYDIGMRHHLPIKQVIGFDGKLTSQTGIYAGLRVKAARIKVAQDLQAKGLIEKIDSTYVHMVGTCYRCGTVLEPLPMTQWFIRVQPLTDKAKKAIQDKKITFIPKRFEKQATRWLTDFHDWNISRQVVWGIKIPAWKCTGCMKKGVAEEKSWIVTGGEKPNECPRCHHTDLTQETDTFDTWFSSGQWPFATLMSCSGSKIEDQRLRIDEEISDFNYFYPTSIMETGYDILPWWVCRMIMLGIYATGRVPFKMVYLHGLVRDGKGQKMSKSKGNVVNPIDMVEKYGADALRMTLIFGTAPGNDQAFSEDKTRGMRNFANKLWNITRLLLMNIESANIKELPFYDKQMEKNISESDTQILATLRLLIVATTKDMEKYRFSDAAQRIYEYVWHEVADRYIEENKDRFKNGDVQALSVFRHVLLVALKLLHPFMPFITEELWNKIPKKTSLPLIVSSWPKEH